MCVADAILILTTSRRTFICSFSAKCILLVAETLHFLGDMQRLSQVLWKADTVQRNFYTKHCACCLPGQRERRGERNIFSGLICPVLRWSETSDAFRGSRPCKCYLKHRKEAFQRKSDFSLKNFVKRPMWADLPQEEKSWWALGVEINFKGPGKQASEMIIIFLLFFLFFLVWHTFKSYWM